MDFFELVAKRRSVRAFMARPIAEAELAEVLKAAQAAPSAGNLQSYEIYVVEGKRRREELARAAHEQYFVAGAPVALVFCMHYGRASARYGRRARLYAMQDATIACAFSMLAASAQGLGCVWVGAFDPKVVRRIIGAPTTALPIAILPIGYPAEAPESRERRPLDDLVHRVE